MSRAELFDRISHSTQEAILKLRVRSALNPGLWLCGAVTIPALAAAAFTTGGMRVFCLSLGALPVVVTSVGFLFFMKNDPDRLQSEEYRIQQRALDIVQEKGGAVQIAPASLEAIANPSLTALPPGRMDDQE